MKSRADYSEYFAFQILHDKHKHLLSDAEERPNNKLPSI